MPKLNLGTKSLFWEIVVPEPFILDSEISEDEFISKMVSANNQDEISNVVFDCLQRPVNTFVIYCAEKDLPKIFNFDGYYYKCKVEKYDKHILLEVRNIDNEYVGRWEIIKIGEKISQTKARDQLVKHMKNFIYNFECGNKRMETIMSKMKMLKHQIDLPNIKTLCN